MANPKSDNLFHFTRSLDYLQSILKEGLYPRYCLEDTRWLEIPFVAIPMVCFCDIPISRISEHTAFYGSYGLGLSKEWGLKNLLQPLIYTPSKGAVTGFLRGLLEVEQEKIDKIEEIFPLSKHFQAVSSILKPLSGSMLIGEGVVEKDFYQENEWRFVPPEFEAAFRRDLDSKRDELNASVAQHVLRFSPQDVRYIFVKSEAEIPFIFDFIQNNLGHWPLNDIKILTSRITSLDTLTKDV